jgi:hypothetical protein
MVVWKVFRRDGDRLCSAIPWERHTLWYTPGEWTEAVEGKLFAFDRAEEAVRFARSRSILHRMEVWVCEASDDAEWPAWVGSSEESFALYWRGDLHFVTRPPCGTVLVSGVRPLRQVYGEDRSVL